MSAPQIWSYRAGGGFLDKHPIASQGWVPGGLQTRTLGVPGALRSRAVVVNHSLPNIYAQLGLYVEAAEKLAEVAHEVLHVVEWDTEDYTLMRKFRAVIVPFRDPDAVPIKKTETEGSDQ